MLKPTLTLDLHVAFDRVSGKRIGPRADDVRTTILERLLGRTIVVPQLLGGRPSKRRIRPRKRKLALGLQVGVGKCDDDSQVARGKRTHVPKGRLRGARIRDLGEQNQ